MFFSGPPYPIDEDEVSRLLGKLSTNGSLTRYVKMWVWMDDVCLIHHDLNNLQKILDVTNHVANKYHIQFGAAKCKLIKRGKEKKSTLKLNGETFEEVPKYKYL